jgi:acyl dehydratase
MAGDIKATDIASLMKFGKYFDMRKAQAAVADVTGGGGAEQSPEEIVDMIFERMPEGFLPEKAEGWNAVLHFEVTGVGEYTLAIEDGKCTSMKGKEGAPKGTIIFSSADVIIGMISGQVKPEQAFMAGDIKADNMGALMKFGQIFDMRKGAEEARKLRGGGKASSNGKPQGLNRDLIGKQYHADAHWVRAEQFAAYASATDDDNPWYLDQAREGGVVSPPLFLARPLMKSVERLVVDRDLRVNVLALVHGEQDMIFHQPVRHMDLVTPRCEVYGIEDKSSGQILACKQFLWVDGELVNETISTYFVRGYTEFTGERKPKAAPQPDPERDYLFEVKNTVAADQPIRYAHASGDTNPIHMDPEIARAAGHPSIILHGMCTLAFAHNAIINEYLGGDPNRLKRIKTRFSKVVLPGMVLTTRGWIKEQTADKTIIAFETVNQDGVKVLTNAEAEVSSA